VNGKIAIVVLCAVAGLAALVGAPGGASAQAKKGAGGVIRLEEMVIEGRVRKPNAFFINTRDAMVYKVLEISESFVEEIPRALDSGRF
jgi:hypothetical protein